MCLSDNCRFPIWQGWQTLFACTCMFRICLSCRGAPTPAGTSMFTTWELSTHMKCEVKHNLDMVGHLRGLPSTSRTEGSLLDTYSDTQSTVCIAFIFFQPKFSVIFMPPFSLSMAVKYLLYLPFLACIISCCRTQMPQKGCRPSPEKTWLTWH